MVLLLNYLDSVMCVQIFFYCVASPVVVCSVTKSCLTLWALMTCQALLSKKFSRQEYWSGLPFPGCLPDLEIEPTSLHLLHCQADSFTAKPLGNPLPSCQAHTIKFLANFMNTLIMSVSFSL